MNIVNTDTEGNLIEYKNRLLELLEKILELFEKYRRPKPWEVMKEITKSLDEITVANAANTAVIADLVELATGLVDGKINDLDPEQAEAFLKDALEKLNKADRDPSVKVDYTSFETMLDDKISELDKEKLVLCKDENNKLYLCVEDKDGEYKKTFEIADNLKNDKIDISISANQSMTDNLTKLPLEIKDGEARVDIIEQAIFSELVTSNAEYKKLADNAAKKYENANEDKSLLMQEVEKVQKIVDYYASHTDKQFSADGRFISFVDDKRQFHVYDAKNKKSVVFEQRKDKITATLHFEHDENMMPSTNNGDKAFMIAQWANSKDGGINYVYNKDDSGVVGDIFKTELAQQYCRDVIGLNDNNIKTIVTLYNPNEKNPKYNTKKPTKNNTKSPAKKETQEANKDNDTPAPVAPSVDAQETQNAPVPVPEAQTATQSIDDMFMGNVKPPVEVDYVNNLCAAVFKEMQEEKGKNGISSINLTHGDGEKDAACFVIMSKKQEFLYISINNEGKPDKIELRDDSGKKEIGRFIGNNLMINPQLPASDRNNAFVMSTTAIFNEKYANAVNYYDVMKNGTANIQTPVEDKKRSDKVIQKETQEYKQELTAAISRLNEMMNLDSFDSVVQYAENELKFAAINGKSERERAIYAEAIETVKIAGSEVDLSTEQGKQEFNDKITSEIDRRTEEYNQRVQQSSDEQKKHPKTTKKEVER